MNSHWFRLSRPNTPDVEFSLGLLSGKISTLKLRANATLLCVMLFIASSISSLAQTNMWIQKSDLGYDAPDVPEPSARYDAVAFSIGSKGYLGTGYSGAYCKDFWEYDPDTNTWTQKADFGGNARYSAIGFSIGSKGYLGTGYYNGLYYKDFWEYDPAANTWTQRADFGGTARSDGVGFSIGSKGYLGTGLYYDGTYHYYQDFWEYDPDANTWTPKADFGGTARGYAVGFSIGSEGYLGTGYNSGTYYEDFWEYDPDDNTWTLIADFGGSARYGAVGFSIGSKGYLGTGYISGTYYKDFWEYDPDDNTWTLIADFGGTGRHSAVGFSIGGMGYIGTGYGGTFVNDF